MKIKFAVCASLLLLTIMACSYGGGDGSEPQENPILSKEYDMWEYVVSNTDVTKNYDLYDTDSHYNPIGKPQVNAGQIKETVMSQDAVLYEEYLNGTLVDTQTQSILTSQGINNAMMLDGVASYRYAKLFSPLNEHCIFMNHYEDYKPLSGYAFKDVVYIQCDTYSNFYAKGVGKVIAQNHKTVDNGANVIDSYSENIVNSVMVTP